MKLEALQDMEDKELDKLIDSVLKELRRHNNQPRRENIIRRFLKFLVKK